MREILFRGKRLDVGEWEEGSLVKTVDSLLGVERFSIIRQRVTDAGILTPFHTWCAVDPKTVGQYTGMADKNGKRIFEGDIVKHYNMCNDPKAYDVGHVYYFQDRCKWKRTTFDGFNKTGRPIDDPEMHVRSKYEVIGNIYDNSELLVEVEG